MTLIINFLGQPSSGKSTTAVRLYSRLKEMDLNVEYSPEVVKTWCYTGQKVTKYDQYYLFGSEVYQQSRLFNAVDIIISDSSPILAAFYNYYYNSGDSSLSPACKEFYRKINEDNIKVVNFLLPRKKKYVTRGRYQTKEQADNVAILLKEWLDREGYAYKTLDCDDEERLDLILDTLKDLIGDSNGTLDK